MLCNFLRVCVLCNFLRVCVLCNFLRVCVLCNFLRVVGIQVSDIRSLDLATWLRRLLFVRVYYLCGSSLLYLIFVGARLF